MTTTKKTCWAVCAGFLVSFAMGAAAYAGGDETFNARGTFEGAKAVAKGLGVSSLPPGCYSEEISGGGASIDVLVKRDGTLGGSSGALPQYKIVVHCSTYWSRGHRHFFGLITEVVPMVVCNVYLHRARYVDKNKDGKIGPGDVVEWWMEPLNVTPRDVAYMGSDTGAAANAAVAEVMGHLTKAKGNGPGTLKLP